MKKNLLCQERGVHAEPETADEISIGRMYGYGDLVSQHYLTALYRYQLASATDDTAAMAGAQRIEQLINLPH